MTYFPDEKEVDDRVEECKNDVKYSVENMHPTDRAESYRAIETWAGNRAKAQETVNDLKGVPERGQDG